MNFLHKFQPCGIWNYITFLLYFPVYFLPLKWKNKKINEDEVEIFKMADEDEVELGGWGGIMKDDELQNN